MHILRAKQSVLLREIKHMYYLICLYCQNLAVKFGRLPKNMYFCALNHNFYVQTEHSPIAQPIYMVAKCVLHSSASDTFRKELLSCGSAIEVLAPQSLREEMKAQIRKMMGMYEA